MNEATQFPGVCRRATEALAGMGSRSQAMARSAIEKARTTARATDDYVHGSPWILIGIATLIAAAAAYVLGRR
jgi:ElaB/YqjD/DUF883 family membrane-anchored ribosome-binding protein